jgi:hypothetical protein
MPKLSWVKAPLTGMAMLELTVIAILIVYMLWSFLCSRFNKNARVADRNVKIWELLHFPLSFGLLLLLGAIVVCDPVVISVEEH